MKTSKLLRFMIVLLALLSIISGCGISGNREPLSNPNSSINDDSQVLQELPNEVSADYNNASDTMIPSIDINTKNATFFEDDGYTQYFWKAENDGCVLYAIDKNASYARQLAIFPPGCKYGGPEAINYISNFGICGDWLIVSVGHFEGSGSYFCGDYARLKKDGSELEHFWLTDDHTFFIVDDWIYYNVWTAKYGAEGCYRIRPDGTDKEYLGNAIQSIIFNDKDGYLYGKHDTDEMLNGWNPVPDMILFKPDDDEMITLFKGDTLPKFDDSDYIRYYDVEVTDGSVAFTAIVHGYSSGDRGYGHILYLANYCVSKDGANLSLLGEEYDPR